ncbi:MAG: peptidyl-prolyl cis-trans isomerase [Deltaproteobacteria bacterium]|nr:peptidyl-prolyl cis-trans isomerase [Deltaproteobacteria bacterium]
MVHTSFMRYLIFLSLCLFVLFTRSGCSPKGGSSQSTVVRVGDRTITLGDLERIVDITSLENEISKAAVWLCINSLVDRIVDESLILAYGKEQGISIPEIELERAMQDIVKDYPDNSFQETLLSRCIDYSEWKQRLREQLLIDKIIREQTGSLPPISHHAIKSYYEERKEEFRHPPRVKLLHIITKERREAEDLYARLKGGEDMAQLLEEQSADSALQGDYGTEWRTGGMFPPVLSHRAFSMEVGKTSAIIETQYGFHIIKVLKREPAGRKGFLEVVAEIEKRLVSEATEQRYRVWLQKLRDTYRIKVDYSLLDKKKAEYAGS